MNQIPPFESHGDIAPEAFADLKSELSTLKADLARLTEALGKTARDGAKDVAEEAEAALGKVGEWTEDQYASLRDTVQAQPLAACAIAAGVGFLLGVFLLRR